MMGIESTKDVNLERRAILEDFFSRIWADGSFVRWVNPKTQKLNVKDVANKILKTSDSSIFSKWAQPFRDNFNERYQKWRQGHDNMVSRCDVTDQLDLTSGNEALDEFLVELLKSDIAAKNIAHIDNNTLKVILNSYQVLSCERFLIKIENLKTQVKELETQINKANKKVIFLTETIEILKSARAIEDKHYMESIRNLYSYDVDMFNTENKHS